MADRPYLRSLSDRVGILPEYFDIAGALHVTPDDTRVALLSAMGFDASTESAAARVVRDLRRSKRDRLLAPVHVVRRRAKGLPRVRLAIPAGASSVDWHLELHQEDGQVHSLHGRANANGTDRRLDVPLPVNPPVGYHTVRAAVEFGGGIRESEQWLAVAPRRCAELSKRLGDQRGFGVWTSLYTVRSRRNWGVGDLTDLADLARALAPFGAAFVGINPLHALANRDGRISPYCPASRLFRNLIYMDIEAVPEFAQSREVQLLVTSRAFQDKLARLRATRLVDYEAIAAVKTDVLRQLHDVFVAEHRGGKTERGRAYDEYVRAQGQTLTDFATYAALFESFHPSTRARDGWRHWPNAYQHPDSPEVEAFRAANTDDVDFHRYIQFELDRQLGEADAATKRSNMPLGLYPDLAIGSAPGGYDTWAFPDLFVAGVEVGAPPDPYSDTGQTWGTPPVHPLRLAARRFDYWIKLLRASFAHAGMLRIDHVMGLFRQYWVPDGMPATQGAYVRYPAGAMFGILALESRRHGTVIVGEDLGTVPLEVPAMMERRGILSSRVVYFERKDDGAFRPAASYSKRALVTATTHDHVPLAGFWTGRDLTARAEIGLIGTDQYKELRRQRSVARAALLAALVAEGIALEEEHTTPQDLCAAVHAFLARTPSPIIGLSLDDLAGEEDPVNLPGVTVDRYPSWSRRMRRALEDILADPRVRQVLAETRAARTGENGHR